MIMHFSKRFYAGVALVSIGCLQNGFAYDQNEIQNQISKMNLSFPRSLRERAYNDDRQKMGETYIILGRDTTSSSQSISYFNAPVETTEIPVTEKSPLAKILGWVFGILGGLSLVALFSVLALRRGWSFQKCRDQIQTRREKNNALAGQLSRDQLDTGDLADKYSRDGSDGDTLSDEDAGTTIVGSKYSHIVRDVEEGIEFDDTVDLLATPQEKHDPEPASKSWFGWM